MCFSPEADVAVGAVVAVVAVDALRHVRARNELLLASLPMVFAVHQLIEAFVWWGLDGDVAWTVGRAALWGYLGIAFVLPVLVPASVLMVEPSRRRRELMTACLGLGAAVTAVLLVAMARGPVTAVAAARHVGYEVGTGSGGELVVLYVLATCGALLASSSRIIAAFGALNLVAVAVLAVLATNGLPSLWCFWAAVTSTVIAWYLRAEPAPALAR